MVSPEVVAELGKTDTSDLQVLSKKLGKAAAPLHWLVVKLPDDGGDGVRSEIEAVLAGVVVLSRAVSEELQNRKFGYGTTKSVQQEARAVEGDQSAGVVSIA